MLELINEARMEHGADPVVLGDNTAAQVHAENSLRSCVYSHWGSDGTKSDMRYILAGGSQYSRENVSGVSFCYTADDRVSPINNLMREVARSVAGYMGSPGHSANIVDTKHRKINIGIAWNEYNYYDVHQFEGDYVEYAQLPVIQDGVLSLSGTLKNGATLSDPEYRDGLGIAIYYDPPLKPLTSGHLVRTSCGRLSVKVANIRRPPLPGNYYGSDEFISTYSSRCPDPYRLPSDVPEPKTREEAKDLKAKARTHPRETFETTGPRITATTWDVSGDSFAVEAGVQEVLDTHGPGVYTVVLWANLSGEQEALSEYTIFYNTELPATQYAR